MRSVVVLLVGLLLLTACGDDDSAGDGSDVVGSAEAPVTEVTVTSPDISFDVEQIYVPVGEEVSVTYDNQDDGVAHNLHVRGEAADGEEPKTDIETGPDVQTITFTMDEAGEYSYVCDVHPQMEGTLTVVP